MNANVIPRSRPFWLALLALLALAGAPRAEASALVDVTAAPYQTDGRIEYVRYSGRFIGETARGTFRVPFEIVAPAHPAFGNRTVVVEPPHFAFGPGGRDATLGPDVLFTRGFSHATVGYSNEGLSLLDPAAGDAVIAGTSVVIDPGAPLVVRDVGIIKAFAKALMHDPEARRMLGEVKRRYAYGVSQSAEALQELFYGVGAPGLFDLTVLHVHLWRPPFANPDVLAALPEDFEPLPDIGKVMIVGAEGDQLISESVALRNAVSSPNYRVYEVAGAPHLALDVPVGPGVRTNSLEVAPVVRAAFVQGHRWVRWPGARPPRSRLLKSDAPGAIDPVYGRETGIARNADLNARGGVRLPDVAVGRAFYQASFDGIPVAGLIGLVGLEFDLACAPRPRSASDRPRFRSERHYQRAVARRTLRLLFQGLLLPDDARRILDTAAASGVGAPGSCG